MFHRLLVSDAMGEDGLRRVSWSEFHNKDQEARYLAWLAAGDVGIHWGEDALEIGAASSGNR